MDPHAIGNSNEFLPLRVQLDAKLVRVPDCKRNRPARAASSQAAGGRDVDRETELGCRGQVGTHRFKKRAFAGPAGVFGITSRGAPADGSHQRNKSGNQLELHGGNAGVSHPISIRLANAPQRSPGGLPAGVRSRLAKRAKGMRPSLTFCDHAGHSRGRFEDEANAGAGVRPRAATGSCRSSSSPKVPRAGAALCGGRFAAAQVGGCRTAALTIGVTRRSAFCLCLLLSVR